MIEEDIEIRTPDGTADAVLFHDSDGRSLPGVLQLTDIGGIRPATRDMARRLAAKGYTVLMPNVFYRTSRPPLFDFPRKPGDERTLKRFHELAGPVTPEAMARDASAYVDFLAAQSSVKAGPMAVAGYCFGGAMALRMAAAHPDQIAAAASFHGGSLVTDAPTSPHLVLPHVSARLYFGHATGDSAMPPEAIAKLDRALAEWNGRYENEMYDARHGWTVSDSPAYNEQEADRALDKLTALLAETLA